MSNWWKRLLGLDEEVYLDEEGYYQEFNQNPDHPKSTKGRFEDSARRIEVKMVNQYPVNGNRKKHNHSNINVNGEGVRRSHQTDAYDEPAYKRKSYQHQTNQRPQNNRQGHVPGSTKSRSNKTYQHRVPTDYGSHDKVESPARVPFRPTMVPSPVFGFRPRSEYQKQVEKPEIMPASAEEPTDVQVLEEMYYQEDVEVFNPESDAFYEEGFESDVSSLLDSEYVEEAEEHEAETLIETIETNPVEEVKVESTSSTTSTTEKNNNSSGLPYNVLMFGADRQALRQREQKLVQSAGVEKMSTTGIQEPKRVATSPQQRADSTMEKKELPVTLFQDPPRDLTDDGAWISEKREILKQVLKNFHVHADIVSHVQGPTVTRFEIRLHPGVKVSKVIGLTEDIKLSMAAEQIRIAPVVGKSTVGIEIPNGKRKSVYLKRLLESDAYKNSTTPLTAALGIDISGREVVTDLSKMPHGLIAGATGSGKSVCIHSLILSLIYKSDPESLRLVLIDPKVVELSMYQRLPHLAAPVINQPKDAALALRWAVEEMEKRYQAFADIGVRDIKKYNQTVSKDEKWPYIVIIIDELADLMMVSPQDVEESICRIAQKARAAGIHLLLATQRPSVDVITGLIKANVPTRIAFGVSSQADSRTILDSGGAERLLGQGDMLFAENGSRDIQRLQGAFVSDDEIDRVTEFFMSWPSPPHLFDPEELREQKQLSDGEDDELYQDAAYFVIEQGQASVSSLQRRFRIGYNRAARLIDSLEAHDVITEANGSKPRQVLMTKEIFSDRATE